MGHGRYRGNNGYPVRAPKTTRMTQSKLLAWISFCNVTGYDLRSVTRIPMSEGIFSGWLAIRQYGRLQCEPTLAQDIKSKSAAGKTRTANGRISGQIE
jgi:hypothetical protein